MASIITFFATICQFLALLRASIMQIFVSKKSTHVNVPSDLESGLSPSSMAKADLATDGNVVHIQKDVQLPPPEVTEDDPSPIARRPSRPVSTVHPVKSRIVEATFKQVQDKTLIKTVVITPCSVVALPCSAVVEYYDPRKDAILVTTMSKTAKPGRSVQFVHPPTVINDDTYDVDSDGGFARDSESISDLLDLFPAPPKHLPPSPAPTCGLPLTPTSQVRVLVEGTARRTSRVVKIRPALILTQSSPYNSDAESTRSIRSLSSDTQSVELCLNGTPKFLSPDMAYFVDAPTDPCTAEVGICDHEDDEVARELEEYAAEEAADAALRLAQARILSNGHFAVVMSPSSTNLSALAQFSQDSDTSQDTHDSETSQDSNEPQDSLETLNAQDSDYSEYSLDAKNSYGSHSSKDITLSDCTPALLPKALVTPYHNVVDGYTNADRHKGDIVDRAFRTKTGTATALTQADTILRELLRTSPSKDEIVDCLLAQLENSFECDSDDELQWAKRRESLAWVDGQVTLTDGVKARLHKHLSLHGGKSKSALLAAAVRKEEETKRSARASWEVSMEMVLRTFREIETEDEDFRDMFYNDCSSVYSQSSLHRNTRDSKEDSGSSLDLSQDRTSDESFGSADRFLDSGEVTAVFELSPQDSEQVVDNTEARSVLALSGVGIVVKNVGLPLESGAKVDVIEAALVPPNDSEYESSSGDGSEDCTARCSWAATGTATEDEGGEVGDDEDEENDSETDQWSDVLTLDEYTAP
ncbi:hypothetical protein D9619_008764 [Psilocybe cf. subviscida]|uniref:Uncharacterized protein n=1 Tax=Psilocybe cf. subviscida TaxID=2480587 RepID=A0A8H5F0I8_9AGAR|nr:hypothetical protein D9619_008764 [Psilocybe cf. subviscida]